MAIASEQLEYIKPVGIYLLAPQHVFIGIYYTFSRSLAKF